MKKIKMVLIIIVLLILFVLIGSFIINCYVKKSTEKQIMDIKKVPEKVDAIIVLGASIRKDGSLSHMLRDRLIVGVDAYKQGLSSKIIMSGDHGRNDYDEVTPMKNFAIEQGIDSDSIFLDHAGFSTYDSIYRAKHIFDLKKIAIVTQKYHLYRALYIANSLGLEAYGIEADKNIYSGQSYRDLREYLARNKDFVMSILKPESQYVGEQIDINSSGDLTN